MTPEQLDDLKAIQELKARYCRFMDTKQWDQWRTLFSEDLVMDVSDDVPEELGTAITHGRDKSTAQVEAFVGHAITVHQVHTPEIALTSDRSATGLWAMADVVIWPEGTSPMPGVNSIHGYGHYHETYCKEADGWKIATLKLTRLHVIPG